jgi:23S rRNA (guanosine2251-2'-O)-methyltransferase
MLDMPIAISYNSYDLANELKQVGFSLVGADMEGYEAKDITREPNQKIALFLGSEGEGLSNKLKKKLDLKVAIGMKNDFDSLNVSVAAGILIYELK